MTIVNLFVSIMISTLVTYLIWVSTCWGSKKRAILNLTFGMFPLFFAIVDLIYGIEVWKRYDQGIQFLIFFFLFVGWFIILDYTDTKRLYSDEISWKPVIVVGLLNLFAFALSMLLLNVN